MDENREFFYAGWPDVDSKTLKKLVKDSGCFDSANALKSHACEQT